MNLYITQNSYYFVHRHFINLFGKEKSKIIYVKESGRGITKKYIEIIQNFGLLNTLISICKLGNFSSNQILTLSDCNIYFFFPNL